MKACKVFVSCVASDACENAGACKAVSCISSCMSPSHCAHYGHCLRTVSGHQGVEDAVPAVKLETVDHPAHYGGAGNPYEAIKVIEAWQLGFCLGNAVKYIARAGKKGDLVEDLRKARWYLDYEIEKLAPVEHQNYPDAHPGWTGPYYAPQILPWHPHWKTHLIPSGKVPRGLQQTIIRQGEDPLYKVEVKDGGTDRPA